jgi:hypothetical protein
MDRLLGYALGALIAGIAGLGIYALYGWLSGSTQTANLVSQDYTIYACVKANTQNSSTQYGTIAFTTAQLQQIGCLVSGTNTYGGAITATGATASLYVDQDAVPQSVCTQTLTQTAANTGAVSFGVAAAGTTPATFNTAVPVPLATAVTLCTNTTNKIRTVYQ